MPKEDVEMPTKTGRDDDKCFGGILSAPLPKEPKEDIEEENEYPSQYDETSWQQNEQFSVPLSTKNKRKSNGGSVFLSPKGQRESKYKESISSSLLDCDPSSSNTAHHSEFNRVIIKKDTSNSHSSQSTTSSTANSLRGRRS